MVEEPAATAAERDALAPSLAWLPLFPSVSRLNVTPTARAAAAAAVPDAISLEVDMPRQIVNCCDVVL